jgi:hypothetical protein
LGEERQPRRRDARRPALSALLGDHSPVIRRVVTLTPERIA